MNSNRNRRFLNNVICNIILALFTAFGVSGCTTRMALDASKGSYAHLSKPIGIFTLRTENTYKPFFEPEVKIIKVVSNKAFGPKKPFKREKNGYLEYLVSVDLAPGAYTLGRVYGQATAGGGLLISGNFNFPINARFNLVSGVTYLGHVTMINRQRKEGEERSGGIFPLVDQAVCGFSGGTFDVTVTDRGETDIPDFVRAYPPLKDVNITKAIMQK